MSKLNVFQLVVCVLLGMYMGGLGGPMHHNPPPQQPMYGHQPMGPQPPLGPRQGYPPGGNFPPRMTEYEIRSRELEELEEYDEGTFDQLTRWGGSAEPAPSNVRIMDQEPMYSHQQRHPLPPRNHFNNV